MYEGRRDVVLIFSSSLAPSNSCQHTCYNFFLSIWVCLISLFPFEFSLYVFPIYCTQLLTLFCEEQRILFISALEDIVHCLQRRGGKESKSRPELPQNAIKFLYVTYLLLCLCPYKPPPKLPFSGPYFLCFPAVTNHVDWCLFPIAVMAVSDYCPFSLHRAGGGVRGELHPGVDDEK